MTDTTGGKPGLELMGKVETTSSIGAWSKAASANSHSSRKAGRHGAGGNYRTSSKINTKNQQDKASIKSGQGATPQAKQKSSVAEAPMSMLLQGVGRRVPKLARFILDIGASEHIVSDPKFLREKFQDIRRSDSEPSVLYPELLSDGSKRRMRDKELSIQ